MNIYSFQYIDREMKNIHKSKAIFTVNYLLDDKSLEGARGSLKPFFSPNLEIENEPNLFGLIHLLLDDIVNMGSCIERISENYPPYNVRLYLKMLNEKCM